LPLQVPRIFRDDNQLTYMCVGTLSIPRAQFEALIEANGGTNVKTVTNSCTHLIRCEFSALISSNIIAVDCFTDDVGLSSETGTKKCADAEAKGVVVVNEDWIRSRIDGGIASVPAPPAKKAVTAAQPAKQSSSTSDGVFSGLNFNVAGMSVCLLYSGEVIEL
jgi:hypothetical protein